MLAMSWLSLSIIAVMFVLVTLVFVQIRKRHRKAAELRHEMELDNVQLDHEMSAHSRDEAVWRRSYSR